MKNNYQKIKIVFFSIMLISMIEKSYAQPIGTPNGTITPWNPANSSFAWFRGGNTATVTGGLSNNIFGTFWNSPIYTYTDSQFRQVILGSITSPTTIAATPQNKSGFMGINTQDPWSRVHIVNGIYGACGGYRPWMREGLNIQTNDDQLWFGHKSFGNPDQQNAVINWSDDPGISGSGPDHLVINFTSTSASLATYPVQGVNPNAQTLAGREMMRFTDNGNIGIGPRFSNAFTPQSTLHQHQQNDASSWMQISNQYMTATGGNTNTAATFVNNVDGLRWGILGNSNLDRNGNAFIYNQEQRHLIFSTGNAVPNDITITQERFRITAVQNPTEQPGGSYGTYNPWGVAGRITRTSISRDPNIPVVRPMTMLHLGYDYNGANTFGWRNWMDIGTMYLSSTNDHMYVGLKQESAGRNDAVVSWGKNANAGAYERLRFIFSSNTGNSANPEGLEVSRMWSDGNEGRMGVGDFFTLASEPQNTVHINSTAPDDQTVGGSSGLRFEDLTSNSPTLAANPGLGVLSVDANGDVIYVPGGTGGVGAQICNTMPINNVSKWTGTELCETIIWDDAARVGIDQINPTAKFSILNGGAQNFIMDIKNSNNQFTLQQLNDGETRFNAFSPVNGKGYGFITDYNNAAPMGFANGMEVTTQTSGGVAPDNIHGFQSTVAGDVPQYHRAIIAEPTNTNTAITAGNIGYQAIIEQSTNTNVGITLSISNAVNNYGIISNVSALPNNYAGYFDGNVTVTGTFNNPSDDNLKINEQNIINANQILSDMSPVTFNYDLANYPQINLASGLQYGLIAQQVEVNHPEFVTNQTAPAKIDANGNVVYPSLNYKGINYNAFIPILIAGHNELKNEIEVKDSVINSLQDQINTLYGMITSCCSNNSNSQNNSIQQNQNNLNSLDITLTDNTTSIVLDQNVPNPFAEQTTITFTLVEGVKKAQMLFYNIEGKLIQSVELSTSAGQGQINVFANDLSTGVYTYTLVVDGEIKGTKRMVKE